MITLYNKRKRIKMNKNKIQKIKKAISLIESVTKKKVVLKENETTNTLSDKLYTLNVINDFTPGADQDYVKDELLVDAKQNILNTYNKYEVIVKTLLSKLDKKMTLSKEQVETIDELMYDGSDGYESDYFWARYMPEIYNEQIAFLKTLIK